jgi:phosphoesterase RecJ-like protein
MNPRPESLLLANRHILILTHVAPDADAIGGLLALGQGLQALGKQVIMACSDPLPVAYAHLPGAGQVVDRLEEALVHEGLDLVVSLDCGDRKRLGALGQPERWGDGLTASRIRLLNIDHHVTNTAFGDVNWVDPAAVATCEMVLDLLDRLEVPIETDIATCLLYGIVGDTQALRTPNVTPQVLARVIRLMQLGASLQQAITDLFQRKPLSQLAVWGRALSTMQVEAGVAWTMLSRQVRQACGYASTHGLNLASLLLEAEGVEVAAAFVENAEGQIDISLRAREGVDVSGLALELGGGGHAAAAGAQVSGVLDEVACHIVEQLKSLVGSSSAGHA